MFECLRLPIRISESDCGFSYLEMSKYGCCDVETLYFWFFVQNLYLDIWILITCMVGKDFYNFWARSVPSSRQRGPHTRKHRFKHGERNWSLNPTITLHRERESICCSVARGISSQFLIQVYLMQEWFYCKNYIQEETKSKLNSKSTYCCYVHSYVLIHDYSTSLLVNSETDWRVLLKGFWRLCITLSIYMCQEFLYYLIF